MTCGGSYAGPVSGKEYSAVALYGNGDYCTTSYEFVGTNKKYRIVGSFMLGRPVCRSKSGTGSCLYVQHVE